MSLPDIITMVIACLALLLSVVSLVVQGREANAADRSADEAARSADAAEASAQVAEDERARATERSDVDFTMRKAKQAGIFHFENVGGDNAYSVEVVLYIDGKRYVVGSEVIEAGSSLVLDADADYREKVERSRASTRSSQELGLVVVRGAPSFKPTSARITWLTACGTPQVKSLVESS